jgi:hypothetical protein
MPNAITKSRAPRRNKNRRQRKTTSAKSEVARFAGDAFDLGARALEGVKYLKNLINIEYKRFDNNLTDQPTTTATMTCLSQCSQGLANYQRVGDSLRLQHFEAKIAIERHASATSTRYRIMILRDNECVGAAANPAAFMVDPSTNGDLTPFTSQAIESKRFGVLFDTAGILDSSNLHEIYSISMPHNGHIKYIDTTGLVTAAGSGAIFLYLWSSEATNKPTLRNFSRFTYTDD